LPNCKKKKKKKKKKYLYTSTGVFCYADGIPSSRTRLSLSQGKKDFVSLKTPRDVSTRMKERKDTRAVSFFFFFSLKNKLKLHLAPNSIFLYDKCDVIPNPPKTVG
jgi:hypothetical protein